jgi:hypothetical protein
VFLGWTALRLRGSMRGRGTGVLGRVIVVLAAAALALILMGRAFREIPWGVSEFGPFPGVVGLLLLAVCFPAALVYMLARAAGWARGGWFILFTVAHGSLACLGFLVVREWLSRYG